MLRLWECSDDYPDRLVGEYDENSSSDRFLLTKGLSLRETWKPARILFEASAEELRHWDCLLNTTLVPLVSERTRQLLERESNEIEFLQASVETISGTLEQFSILNATRAVAALDHTSSVYKKIRGTDSILSFSKLVYREELMDGSAIARSADYPPHLLIAKNLADKLIAATISGLRLVTPEEISIAP